LAVGAAILWIFIGIPIGIISGIKRGSFWDRAGMLFALIGVSMPVFWLDSCSCTSSGSSWVSRRPPGWRSVEHLAIDRAGQVHPALDHARVTSAAFYARMVAAT
jgi:peptide/nickel transport system permease protein